MMLETDKTKGREGAGGMKEDGSIHFSKQDPGTLKEDCIN